MEKSKFIVFEISGSFYFKKYNHKNTDFFINMEKQYNKKFISQSEAYFLIALEENLHLMRKNGMHYY